MNQPTRPNPVVLFLLVLTLTFGVASGGEKRITSDLEKTIREYKRAGVPLPAQVLDEARARYESRRRETASSLLAALTDGGSSDANATVVDANPYVDNGTTVGKGNNASIPSCLSGGNDTAEDAWYRIDTPVPIELTVSTTCASVGPPSYDTRLGVFDSLLTLLTCNDDAPDCGSPNYQSGISDFLLSAGTYYIVVDGYNGATGPYELNVSWVIAAGACEGGSDATTAQMVTTIPFVDAGTTAGACHNYSLDCELGAAAGAPDYWYSVLLDTTVLIDVWTTCDPAAIDTRVAIVDTNMNQIYCNDDDAGCATGQSAITGAFLYAGEYFVIVEGADTTSGAYEIHIDTTVVDPSENNALLPDIIVRESDLYDHDIVTNIEPGRTHLRLSNGTANIGEGKLYIYGTGVDNGDGTENIMQRVFLPGGGFFDRTAGVFIFHPTHNHIHVEEWGTYRLREVLPGNGVGAIVAKGKKTSFCILDLGVYDNTLPNYNPVPEFNSCSSTIQGLSVGWVDVYSKSLPDQNIDITDVPAGTYWLESVVDQNNWFLEADDSNNVTRIKVTLGGGPAIDPDDYEPNDTTTVVDARPAGGPNSPNLGPCNPQRVLTGLTIHVSGNEDYFKFYMNETGTMADFVGIFFDSTEADLNLELLDAAGLGVDSSVTSTEGTEIVSLNGVTEGWHFARVYSPAGDLITSYSLAIDPPANGAPAVTLIDPPPGTSYIVQGQETYTVTWNASDPEGDQTWVTIWANTTPALDGNEQLLPTSLFTPGEQGFYIVNSAYLGFDTYWFYAEVTDGGTTTGSWSTGNLKLLDITSGAGDTPGVSTHLYPAVPNPFNPTTTLRLELAGRSRVVWRIYDVGGRLVREIHNGDLEAGVHTRLWDGRDDRGRGVSSGIYFQYVSAGAFRQTNKLVLLK